MLDKLVGIEDHYTQLGRDLEEAGSDYQRAAEINKERVDLEPLVTKTQAYRQSLKRVEEARTLIESEKDEELVALAQAEIEELNPEIEKLESEIKSMLEKRDRRVAGMTAPAQGLVLWKVFYQRASGILPEVQLSQCGKKTAGGTPAAR